MRKSHYASYLNERITYEEKQDKKKLLTTIEAIESKVNDILSSTTFSEIGGYGGEFIEVVDGYRMTKEGYIQSIILPNTSVDEEDAKFAIHECL